MFLNAVVLILREILEAALLISVMLALESIWRVRPGKQPIAHRTHWLLFALPIGIVWAWIYARVTPEVSAWFDYAGLEVTNATIQVLIVGCIALFCRRVDPSQPFGRATVLSLAGFVSLCIVREFAEIILFVTGVASQPENLTPVLFGAAIAIGIGISSGVCLFLLLVSLIAPLGSRIGVILLALFTGNMLAQACLQLTQADWLFYTPALWDSSTLIGESTVAGQLLYALIGYEATPSALQLACYISGVLLVVLSPLFQRAWRLNAPARGARGIC